MLPKQLVMRKKRRVPEVVAYGDNRVPSRTSTKRETVALQGKAETSEMQAAHFLSGAPALRETFADRSARGYFARSETRASTPEYCSRPVPLPSGPISKPVKNPATGS
jgi:hypothetical protein